MDAQRKALIDEIDWCIKQGIAGPRSTAALMGASAALKAAPSASAQQAEPVAVELRAVAETVAKGGGFWTPCTGCYDTEDGRPTQKYAHSDVFGCELGTGCRECGGLGAVWDDTDYAEMAEFMEQRDAAPAPSASPAALTDAQIQQLAHRTCAKYMHSDSEEFRQYGFGKLTLLQFARALLAASPADQVEDAARLDFLDELNRRLNEHYGTVYGWELILSPNIVRLMSGPGGRGHLAAIDLNDSKARGAKSCREAIDAAMSTSKEGA